MPAAYGTCRGCGEWGALWRRYVPSRRFLLFGPTIRREVYRCDECDGRGNWPKGALPDAEYIPASVPVDSIDTLGDRLKRADRALSSALLAQKQADETNERAQRLLEEKE